MKVVSQDPNSITLSSQEQTRYQSVVGSLLYLLKHSRPDLSNAVRELTKTMDKAIKRDYELMLKVIKYIEFTKDLGLKLTLLEQN